MQLSEFYRQGAAQREAPDVVDVILGADAVRQRFAQLQASAEHQVSVLMLSDVAFLDAAENDEEERALARGVQVPGDRREGRARVARVHRRGARVGAPR